MSYIFPGIEFLAALVATFTFGKYVASTERYFLFFLWFTALIEVTNPILQDTLGMQLPWLYEIYHVAVFLFYYYWYYTVLKGAQYRGIAIIAAICFLALTAMAYIFPDTMKGKGYAFVTGACGLLILTLIHYYKLLNSNEVLNIKHKLSFWISMALFLFYMGIIPLMLLSDYMGIEDLSYFIILITLNAILYGCFIIGFLWTKKEYNHF